MAVYSSLAEAQAGLDNQVWELGVDGAPLRAAGSQLQLPDGTRLPTSGDRVPLSPAKRKLYQSVLEDRRTSIVAEETATFEAAEEELTADADAVATRIEGWAELVNQKIPDLEVGGFSVEELDAITMDFEKIVNDARTGYGAWDRRATRWDGDADARKDVEAYATTKRVRLWMETPALRNHRPHPLDFPW